MSITRWDIETGPEGGCMYRDKRGDYVEYDSHMDIVSDLEREIAKLENTIEKLLEDIADLTAQLPGAQ